MYCIFIPSMVHYGPKAMLEKIRSLHFFRDQGLFLRSIAEWKADVDFFFQFLFLMRLNHLSGPLLGPVNYPHVATIMIRCGSGIIVHAPYHFRLSRFLSWLFRDHIKIRNMMKFFILGRC